MSVAGSADSLFNRLVTLSGLPALLRSTVQRRRPTVLNYHDPSPETIAEHLRFLDGRFEFVTLRQVVEWVRGDREALPDHAVAITFDDGWAGAAALGPVFREAGVRPTFFVCSGIVGTGRRFWWELPDSYDEVLRLKAIDDAERTRALASMGRDELSEAAGTPSALTLEQLAEVAQWAEVQSHTRLHPILPRCDDERAWSEISGSREEIARLTGSAPYALAYPNGDHGTREIEMAGRAGYEAAFTTVAGYPRRGATPFALPRVPVGDSDSTAELAVKMSTVHYRARRFLLALGLVPPD